MTWIHLLDSFSHRPLYKMAALAQRVAGPCSVARSPVRTPGAAGASLGRQAAVVSFPTQCGALSASRRRQCRPVAAAAEGAAAAAGDGVTGSGIEKSAPGLGAPPASREDRTPPDEGAFFFNTCPVSNAFPPRFQGDADCPHRAAGHGHPAAQVGGEKGSGNGPGKAKRRGEASSPSGPLVHLLYPVIPP